MRPRTEPGNAQNQRRKDRNINQCVNHGSRHERRLSFEGLICPGCSVFPVASDASDEHHSLVLLIGGLLRGTALSRTLAQAGL
jgi:hypothetical protein